MPILRALYNAKPSERKKFLSSVSDDTINALCDCARNIVQGNVPLTTKQYKQLKPYHKQLKGLQRKSSSQKHKRKVLQSGGFLGMLLKPIAKLLLGAFN